MRGMKTVQYCTSRLINVRTDVFHVGPPYKSSVRHFNPAMYSTRMYSYVRVRIE